MRQQKLFSTPSARKTFGGSLLKGKRKTKRPLDVKQALHLVLRANIRGQRSLLFYWGFIELYLPYFSEKFGIKVMRKAVVGNHIHLVLYFRDRKNYVSFIRSFAGTLSKKFKIKWDLRPFSRILNWGRDLKQTIAYVVMNEMEALKLIPYTPRTSRPP